VFTPFTVTGSLVVDTGEEVEVLNRKLVRLDSKLVIQLPYSGTLNTLNSGVERGTRLSWYAQRMGAACVGPHIRKGNLLRGALLEEKSVFRIEEEDGKGAVQQTLVDVLHQMANLLACTADGYVVLIEDDADLVHEADLLFIVAPEVFVLVLDRV